MGRDLLGDCRNEVWMLHRWQGRNRGGRVEGQFREAFPGVLLKSSKSSFCISLRPSARPLTSWMTSPNLRCHLRQKRWSLRICPDSLFVSVQTENGKKFGKRCEKWMEKMPCSNTESTWMVWISDFGGKIWRACGSGPGLGHSTSLVLLS